MVAWGTRRARCLCIYAYVCGTHTRVSRCELFIIRAAGFVVGFFWGGGGVGFVGLGFLFFLGFF